jgi:hypothetical protein
VKEGKSLEAVEGDPARLQEFVDDSRFADGGLWMLNLLTFEPGEGKKWYEEYGVRAQTKIAALGDNSGGLQLYAPKVDLHTEHSPTL